ncbi:MAG: cobalamin biosynthesis protein CbiM [Acidobacteria bacterium]|nr:MAG: cobalamin biosynthesis protein CbiM [Acidobacteriota bacterium]
MHIPDGFLSPAVWATLDLVSVPAVGLLARKAQRDLEDRKIPLLGVMGAFVFAAQMINFPVGPGTTGHLVGGTLLAVTLGPAAAAVVMTAILAIQAFVFQDGGIVVLGANVFNMAIASVLAGYLPYRLWAGSGWRSAAIFAGGVLSVLTSACLALAQLLISGVPMPRRLMLVSLGLFLVSGLIEGAVTLAAVRAIERLNPVWIRSPKDSGSRVLGAVAIAAVTLVAGGVLIASAAPDGIWSLVGKLGLTAQTAPWLHAPLADYQVNGLESAWLRKATAGLFGLVLVYVACFLTGKFIARQRSI